MRKFLIMIFVIILCVLIITACAKSEDVKPDASQSTTTSKTQQAQESEPLVSTGPGLLYIDPKTDLFIKVDAPGWAYTRELYPGEVFFYPKGQKPEEATTSFAISSQEKSEGMDVTKVWDSVKKSLEKGIKDLTVSEKEETKLGKYTFSKYHYTGSTDKVKEMTGDYFFWETDKRIYICSFTSSKEGYDKALEVVLEALKSFKPAKK